MSTGDPVAGAMREAAREGNQSIVQLMVKQFLNVADQVGRDSAREQCVDRRLDWNWE